MKKLLVTILCVTMLATCFGCTAVNQAGSEGTTTSTICSNEDNNNSKEETPTGWSTVIKGRYLKAKTGHLILYDGGPVELRTQDESIFEGLTDGDLIEVGCNYIEESYPGGTTVLYLGKIEDGEYDDLDKNTLGMLGELGWIDYAVTDDEPDALIGYYLENEKGQWLLVDEDLYYLRPHPDMVADVEVLYGYTDGDLISVTCEIEERDEYKVGNVWTSKLIEEGTPDNVLGGIGEE